MLDIYNIVVHLCSKYSWDIVMNENARAAVVMTAVFSLHDKPNLSPVAIWSGCKMQSIYVYKF